MQFIKNYKWASAALFVLLLVYANNPPTGTRAIEITLMNLEEMLTFLPPIFILVGLMDIWVPREIMIRYMGEHSGITGIAIAFLLGTAAAGPLYAAFPLATLLLSKGARLAYVIFLLGVWSSTKLPIVLYEVASLGLAFTTIHIAISLPAYLLTGYGIEKFLATTKSIP